MASEDIALMAHLMRRAGFGASREELEARVATGYEATVEELVHPEAGVIPEEIMPINGFSGRVHQLFDRCLIASCRPRL